MKLRISLAMLAIYLIWGSTYLAIRFAVESIPPFLMAGVRFFFPGLFLIVWRRVSGDPAPTKRQWVSASIVGLLLLTGGNGLVSWSEQRIDSGIAALIVGTVPIWMVVLDSIFLRQKGLQWKSILGLFTGSLGIIILIGPKDLIDGISHYDLLGIGAVLLGSLLWSIGSIYSRNADMPRSPLLGTGMEMLAGCIGLISISWFRGEIGSFNIQLVSVRSVLGLVYLIIAGSLGGFVAYTWLLRNAPIPLVATYAYVNPLVAILLGTLLANEHIDPQVLLATAIILGSVILINSRK